MKYIMFTIAMLFTVAVTGCKEKAEATPKAETVETTTTDTAVEEKVVTPKVEEPVKVEATKKAE